MNSVGVLILSALKNGYDIFVHTSFAFHGWPDLLVVLDDVLVDAVQRHAQRDAGAADRRLEARVGGDRVVGRDAAVAPPADAEPIRIGNALLDRFIHRAEQIDDFEIAPVAVDRLLERVAAARAAAIVDRQHDVAIGGEELAIERERVLILAVRAAVDDQAASDTSCRPCSRPASTISPCTSVPSLLFDWKSSVVASCSSSSSFSLCFVSWRRFEPSSA